MLRDDLTELPLGELSVLRKRIGDKKFARLYRSQGNEQEAEEGSQNVRESDEDNGAHHSRSLSDRSFPTSHRVSGFPSSTSRASVQKRENHNQPLEVSTRRPTAFKRERIREFCSHSSYLSHSRDPRFDERCGEFSEHAFGATFSFLDEMREKEKDQLERTKQHLKKALMKAKRKPAEEVNKGDSVDEVSFSLSIDKLKSIFNQSSFDCDVGTHCRRVAQARKAGESELSAGANQTT